MTIPYSIYKNSMLICIPRMESFIQNSYIKKTFEVNEIGKVIKIIEIPHKNNPAYKRVIVNIDLKKDSKTKEIIEDRFSKSLDVKLVHSSPWYWKMMEAKYK